MEIENILPTRTKTIKVEIRTWNSLKSLKSENETFDDVIRGLLRERTVALGDENIKAIKYQRKIGFFNYGVDEGQLGFEYEYNDAKSSKLDFVLDLIIKKVFYGKKSYNPSEFFGVDNDHKHYSNFFMLHYFVVIASILNKEFSVNYNLGKFDSYFENLVFWKKLYVDYQLSEESFKEDIEKVFNLSEDDKPNESWQKRLDDSVLSKLISKKQIYKPKE